MKGDGRKERKEGSKRQKRDGTERERKQKE